MAFLVLMLVTLATLTQVETQMSTKNQQHIQAQQNALVALQVALGQLQKYAGPDQRTTARADIDVNLAWTSIANGRWLGVYGNGASIDYAEKPSLVSTTIAAGSDARGTQAKLLNWLVSGNENTAFDPIADVADDGHIVAAPTSFSFTPSSTIDLASVSASPGSEDTHVLLVGEHTIDLEEDIIKTTEDYVAAPLVPLAGDGNSGMRGRYAWWIGDENIKANVTLPMASEDQLSEAFVSAQRAAIELVDTTQASAFDQSRLIGNNFDPTASEIVNLSTVTDLPLAASNNSDAMDAAVRANFHGLTAHSESLMVDSYAGGLKQDLSAVLATGATSPADTDYIFTPDNDLPTDTFAVPTWGALRSFAQTQAPTVGLEPRLPTNTDVGVGPVLTYFSLGFQYAAPEGNIAGAPIQLAVFPLVVLWNPYTVPIKAHQYEVGFGKRWYPWGQLQMQNDAGEWVEKESIDFSRGATEHANRGPADSYIRFVIDSPDIPPGASLIFTLQGGESGASYNAPANGKAKNVLTNGLNVLGHVLLNFGSNTVRFAAGDEYRNFRMTGAYLLPPLSDPFGISGGGVYAFLGEVLDKGRTGFTTSADNDKEWYQALMDMSPASDSAANQVTVGRYGRRNEFLQAPGPLGPVYKPELILSMQRNFSHAPPNSIYPDVRWIAQNNTRSLFTMQTPRDNGANPPNLSGGGGRESQWQTFIADTSGKRASAGMSLDSALGIVDASLFEFRPADSPLLSLGQLQHANLSQLAQYPAYPIGNSLGDYHFLNSRDKVQLAGTDPNFPTKQITSYYDISWLLNRVLWDRYFVSTIPYAGTGESTDTSSGTIPATLPNPRIERNGKLSDSELRDADRAAVGLTLKGGFNINSTSEQAWRAVLGGINQLPYDPEVQQISTDTLQAALPRFSKPLDAPGVDLTKAWAWQGYRQLSEEQIAELARNIVAEIRNRGPFVSMADFVNRRLKDNPATTEDERFKGTLQAAIDATYSSSAAVNRGESGAYGVMGSNPFHHDTSALPYYKNNAYDTDLMKGYAGALDGDIPYGSTSAFAPQFLTQADVLSAIGAGLTARSDSFMIRAYGEVLNPITQQPEGRAWCEAIVQRQLDYTDSGANAPEDNLADLSDDNMKFGRQFKIVSFRWLSPEEI